MHGALFQLSFIFCRTKVALILPKLKKSTKYYILPSVFILRTRISSVWKTWVQLVQLRTFMLYFS